MLMLGRALYATAKWPKGPCKHVFGKVIDPKINNNFTKIILNLTHQDENEFGHLFPNAHQKYEVYSRFFGYRIKIEENVSDRNGKSEFQLPLNQWGYADEEEIEIYLKEKPAPFAKWWENDKTLRTTQIFFAKIPKSASVVSLDAACDVYTQSNDFSNIKSQATHLQPSPRYFLGVGGPVLKYIPKAIYIWVRKNRILAKRIQQLYQGKLSVENKSKTQDFIDSLLSRICRIERVKEGNTVTWETKLISYERDREGSICDINVVGKIDTNEKLQLESISYRYPGTLIERAIPGTKKFEYALDQAWRMLALEGEMGPHLAEAHILPLILSKCFSKYIKKNPLHNLLQGHFAGVDFIGYLSAAGIIFGEGSTIAGGGHSPNGVKQKIFDNVARYANWCAYRVPEMVDKDDYFAHDEKLHYEMLVDIYKNFCLANRKEIGAHWYELYRFSKSVNAQLSTCPLMTDKEINPHPTDLELERVAYFWAWIVNILSYKHWMMHEGQSDIGDLEKIVFGQRGYGVNSDGKKVFGANADTEKLNEQLLVLKALMSAKIPESVVLAKKCQYHSEYVTAFKKNLSRFKTPGIKNLTGSTRI